MNKLVLLLLTGGAFAVAATPAQSQNVVAPSEASLMIINAVPGKNSVFISFDGQSIWPLGFSSGTSTSAVTFPAGIKRMEITCDGYVAAVADLELSADSKYALVVYPGDVVTDGPDSGKRRLAAFVPAPLTAEKGRSSQKTWKIVLVGAAKQAQVEINDKVLRLEPRKPSLLTPGEGMLVVRHDGREILATAPQGGGEYWVVVFPTETELRAVSFKLSP